MRQASKSADDERLAREVQGGSSKSTVTLLISDVAEFVAEFLKFVAELLI